jgi:hypothetical protein
MTQVILATVMVVCSTEICQTSKYGILTAAILVMSPASVGRHTSLAHFATTINPLKTKRICFI